jgi:hypothetical protein
MQHGMKLESWIIGGGLGLCIVLSVAAMFADDLWEDDYHDAPPIAAGIPSPHRDGREKIACSSCHVVLAANAAGNMETAPAAGRVAMAPPPIVVGAVAPHRDGRETIPCQNCHQILPRGSMIPMPR